VRIEAANGEVASDVASPGDKVIVSYESKQEAEYDVPSTGLHLPRGRHEWNEYGYPASVGLIIDTGVFNGDVVDAYGNMTVGDAGGWATYKPYVPVILGTFASGDPSTILLAGDSIIYGYADTLTGYGLKGGASQAMADTDHVSNPIAGLNCGFTGATSTMWLGAGNAPLREYLQFANAAVEEFGTNNYNSVPGTNPATVLANSSSLWDYMIAAGITNILRPHLLPRTTADGVTLVNANFESGGDARAFDALLTAASGFPSAVTVLSNNGLRAGSTPDTDAYYQWLGATTNTGDGTHPNAAGCILEAVDYRTAYAV
jgi:lysophospholipase L1-like esterase